ncbi:hypothetical protein [Halomarina oriensis]|uniref:Uncharacterized protein n=1 Tax=Halomarina oriensis TaxID=671145 RepID=A0A6B0GJJ5_9EURY|nr:hypothetical protein [Halomarina oriensis]MWG34770.1 hypothetical protein [Halomarina oriensis]
MRPWPQARGPPVEAETTLDPTFPVVDRDPERTGSDATYDPDSGQVRFAAIHRPDGDVYRTVPAERWAELESVQLARVGLNAFTTDWLGDTEVRGACGDPLPRVWVVYPVVYEDDQRRTVRNAPTVSYDEVLGTVPARVETTLHLGDESFQFEHPVTVERLESVHGRNFR